MAKQFKLPKEALEFFRKNGRVGGRRRAEKMTPEERSEQARKAVQARWARYTKKSETRGTK
jgi:hypothetical protein